VIPGGALRRGGPRSRFDIDIASRNVNDSDPRYVNNSDPRYVKDSDPLYVNDSNPRYVNYSDPRNVNDSDIDRLRSDNDATDGVVTRHRNGYGGNRGNESHRFERRPVCRRRAALGNQWPPAT
jgi:hypothetical protein